jgi:hypothetical protein
VRRPVTATSSGTARTRNPGLAGSLVDQCVNESVVGLTSQSALDSGVVEKVVTDFRDSADTPVVTVILGGNDLRGLDCQPVIVSGCTLIHNVRTILNTLETALATHPGPHVIKWLEYYNPNHDTPFGTASADQMTAGLLLGQDMAVSDCASFTVAPIGLNDAINCIAKERRRHAGGRLRAISERLREHGLFP